ncbi:MAG: C45 family autoproteolytic acyltransferase/hydrolase [Planctomycetota bacterium]|jgi:isopenicillin-N N-acyltransferase-like protein
MLTLPQIDAAGSPRDLGLAQGEALRAMIQDFVAQRLRAARAYLWERGTRDLDGLLSAGRACLELTAAWDPDGIAEHHGIADGADVDPIELFATTNMTDVRDVMLYAGPAAQAISPSADAEGCTALVLGGSHTASGHIVAGQTWDLNPSDLDHVVAIHRQPDHGPETWSVTCSGCQTLVGMNEHGVWLGTTNIKTTDARPGVPYLSLLHRAIRCRDARTALELIQDAPRAGAHTYWAADATWGGMIECCATDSVTQELTDAPLCQTNHCLVDEHIAIQAEDPNSSSRARLNKARAELAAGNHDVMSLRALFADRSDGVDSINRYAEDGQGTATNACIVAIPAERELWACRGTSDRGQWVSLPFDRS